MENYSLHGIEIPLEKGSDSCVYVNSFQKYFWIPLCNISALKFCPPATASTWTTNIYATNFSCGTHYFLQNFFNCPLVFDCSNWSPASPTYWLCEHKY